MGRVGRFPPKKTISHCLLFRQIIHCTGTIVFLVEHLRRQILSVQLLKSLEGLERLDWRAS